VAREFRRRHGMSIASYLRMRRIEWAAARLTESEDSIAQVAAASGFFDQSHFTRLFHRITGETPGRFRAAARTARRSS
jgi:AraC family transcriptional regulator